MTKQLLPANIQWIKGQPFNCQFNDYYFQPEAIAESLHNYIDCNQLSQRFKNCNNFYLCELGFGFGLNFLLTLRQWQKYHSNRGQLHYFAIEQHPVQTDDIQIFAKNFEQFAPEIDLLIKQKPPNNVGFYTLQFTPNVLLHLLYEHCHIALNWLLQTQLSLECNRKFDCFFLDGFSPSRNSAMFDGLTIKYIAQLLQKDGTMSTFSASSQLQRLLKQHAFTIKKHKGFKAKREHITAMMQNSTGCDQSIVNNQIANSKKTISRQPNWHLEQPNDKRHPIKSIAIIGSGAVASAIAYQLAKNALQVQLISDNQPQHPPYVAVHSLLSNDCNAYAHIKLTALHRAHHYYNRLIADCKIQGAMQGFWQFPNNSKQLTLFQQLVARYPQIYQWQRHTQSKQFGLFCLYGGHLNANSVIDYWNNHSNIATKQAVISRIRYQSNQWQLLSNNRIVAQSDAVIIATGAQTSQFLDNIPYNTIAGVGNAIKNATTLTSLHQNRSVLPIDDNSCWVGSSYHLKGSSPDISKESKVNLTACQSMLPNTNVMTVQSTFVGFRCCSQDYLPLIGAVVDEKAMMQSFAKLRYNKYSNINAFGDFQSQLYVATGFGSNAFLYLPSMQLLMQNSVLQEPIVLPNFMQRALHPARFTLQKLIHNN